MTRHWIAALILSAAICAANDTPPVPEEEATPVAAAEETAQDAQPAAESETAEKHRNRGIELLKEQKFREAADELGAAIKVDPKDAYSHYYLGMANSRLKKKDLMVKHYRIFLELAPDAPEAERVRSLLKSL